MANFKRACLQAVKKKEGKLCLHEKMRYFSPKKLALLLSITLTLPVFDAVAAPADYPFPVYPIISQPYINRTTPMIFAFVDNSTTMNTTAKMKDKNNKSIAKSKADFGWPDRIDVVKRGLHGMVDKYYDEFDWGLVVIADQRRQLNWWPYSDSNLGLDGSKPIWESGHAGYDANYGWLQNFPAERRGNLIKWIGDNGSRLPDSSGSWTYHQDSKGKFFGKPMLFAPKSHNDTNKAELLGQIRSINTTLDASFMEDTYPQLLNVDQRRHHTGKKNSYRDMQSIPDFVKFRCQDLFVIVFTDGNRVGDEDNYGPAHWAAENPPKSSNEYDQDTKPQKYNGPDFPNQRIYTSAVGLDTHTDARAKKFETFVNRAGGTFFLSEDADELGAYLKMLMSWENGLKSMLKTNDLSISSRPPLPQPPM